VKETDSAPFRTRAIFSPLQGPSSTAAALHSVFLTATASATSSRGRSSLIFRRRSRARNTRLNGARGLPPLRPAGPRRVRVDIKGNPARTVASLTRRTRPSLAIASLRGPSDRAARRKFLFLFSRISRRAPSCFRCR